MQAWVGFYAYVFGILRVCVFKKTLVPSSQIRPKYNNTLVTIERLKQGKALVGIATAMLHRPVGGLKKKKKKSGEMRDGKSSTLVNLLLPCFPKRQISVVMSYGADIEESVVPAR